MPLGIYENVECDTGKHPLFTAQEHQAELLNYFLNESKYKGLLAFHKLGSGKSCSSILISDQMIKTAKVKKVFVLTPGSLRKNFIEEYCKKCGYKPKYLKKYYTFITINYSVGERIPDLNDSLVIIDEVHNLINGVKNQSKHATLIYDKLLNSSCRILALSGTPIFNYVWEWPFLGNLLKPGTFPIMIRNGVLDEEAFMTKFIIDDDDGNIKPKKPKMFAINLRGIISYFPGKSDGFYPEVVYEKPIQIRMTIPQEEIYWKIATRENKIRQKGPPEKSLLRTDPKKYNKELIEFITCSKYIMSRFYSNFYYPEQFRSSTDSEARDEILHSGKIIKYRYKPTGEVNESKKYFVDMIRKIKLEKYNEKEFTDEKISRKVKRQVEKDVTTEYEIKNIGWINKKQFENNKLVDIYSRKITAVITNIVSNWKSKHVLFTFFKTKGGVNILHALFKMCGIKTEIYSGDISDGTRNKILKNFNSEKNRYGDKIKVLLITEAGAEGINILEAQHMHILESSTREMKIQQAIGRVVRYRSHMVEGYSKMPKNEQVVHIWRYWSTSDTEPYTLKSSFINKDGKHVTNEQIITNKTTVDEILYKQGIFSVNTIQSFVDLLKKASVTYYDKEQDKDSRLKDYGLFHVSSKLNDAYEISNQRYLDSINNDVEQMSISSSGEE